MIVVDTNVIAHFFLASPLTPQAKAVLRKDMEWIAPALWRSEFRNILILFLRHKRLNLPEAQAYFKKAETLMARREQETDSDRVLSLAASSGCTAYDCEFVALAQQLNVPLVTSDKQLLKAFPKTAIALEAFAGAGR